MSRKFGLVAVFLILFLAVQAPVAASSPASWPSLTQDWVHSAIEELGRGRDIPGFEIPPEANRNQEALLVARLLQHLSGEDQTQSRRFGVSHNVYLDSMIFSYNQRVGIDQAFTVQQVELLYQLVLEFGEELEILGYAIQDFKLLSAQGFAEPQGGLFTERKLLFSDQALAAARRAAEQDAIKNESTVTVVQAQTMIAEILPEPIEPLSLWTGQFSSTRFLPASSSFKASEPTVEVGPSLQIGGVEVSGGLRQVTSAPSLDPAESNTEVSDSGAGYGVLMRVGDVALNTALDLGVDRDSLVPKTASTSLDLRWDWADLFTLSAGVRQGLRLGQGEPITPVVTSLGVTVPISRGQVHLGMTQQWNSSLVGGNELLDDELTMSASAAELGLSYQFKNDSSLRFNYRFIDFSNMEPGTEAEAAFSIKF